MRRTADSELRLVKEILMTDDRGQLMSRHRQVVAVKIADTVNTPVAMVSARC